MRAKLILLLLATLFFLIIVNISVATNINSCQNLSAVGTTYTLTKSVNSTGTCFHIVNNNITLDCKGFTINYSQTANLAGVWSNGSNARIVNCVINKTKGAGATNYGVYVFARNATVMNNTIITNGTNDNYGVYVSGSGNTSIVNNTIFARGISAGNYGIRLAVGNNSVLNNSIRTNGTSANYGVYVSAGGSNVMSGNTVNTNGTSANIGLYVSAGGSNVMSGNVVNTDGSANGNYGVRLDGSGNNSVLNNSIRTSGTSTNFGLYVAAGGLNLFSGNVVNTSGSAGSNIGVYLSGSGSNSALNNSISTSGTSSNIGLYAFGGGLNLFSGNVVSTGGSSNQNYGVVLESSRNNSVFGNVVVSGGTTITNHALYLYRANSSVIANNSFVVGSSYGAGINVTESGNNTIYNNIFNATNVAAWSDTVFSNRWNTTLRAGTNIVGGVNFGGNFYANSSGGGFSETCTYTAINDGICDGSFTISAGNIDYFPLTRLTVAANGQFSVSIFLGANLWTSNLTSNTTYAGNQTALFEDVNGDIIFNASTNTQNDVSAFGAGGTSAQNSEGILRYCNTGTTTITPLEINISTPTNSCVKVSAATTSGGTKTQLTDSLFTASASLTASSCQSIWLWANFTSCMAGLVGNSSLISRGT